jgi:hypothetical protein
MEMMDIQAAIQRLNQSSDSMVAMGKILESHKGETDFLKRESLVAQRASIETAMNTSTIAAILIYDQMMLELPLLMGHSEDFLDLVRAQARYRAETSKACSVLNKTAPVNQPAPADSQAPESGTPEDSQQRINRRFEELMAKSSPPAVEPAAAPKADENAGGMSSEAPAGVSSIIVEANTDQATKLSG